MVTLLMAEYACLQVAWLTTGTAAWRSWLEEPPPVAVLPHPTTTGAEEASSEDRSCVVYHRIHIISSNCLLHLARVLVGEAGWLDVAGEGDPPGQLHYRDVIVQRVGVPARVLDRPEDSE